MRGHFRWLDGAWRDLGYAVRVLRRSPRFTITALTLLVLGIGFTTAIISIVHAVVVRPLPYPDADRLVYLTERGGAGVSWPNFEDWRSRATSFDGMASSIADAVIVSSGHVPRRFQSRSVTSNFFRVLGVSAQHGRLFDDGDVRPEAQPTAVLSHAFWMREFGGATSAVGQTFTLNRRAFTIIGVLPAGFRFMTAAEVYIPLEPQVAANYRGMQNRRTQTTHYGIARLKAGATLTTARAEMEAIAAALAREHPTDNTGKEVRIVSLADRIVGDMAATLTVLAGAVALLLLIACVNFAGLLLTASASRAQEFGIRAAIGCSRWMLVRQLAIEQGLLVAAGGVLGAFAGSAILAGLISVAPRDLPRLDEIRLDPIVLAWTTLLGCGCALLCGLAPALRMSGIRSQAIAVRSGRGATRQGSWLRRGFMIAEVAIAMVLLCGSALMVQTMMRLGRIDPGFEPRNLQTFMFSLAGPDWPDARKQAAYETIADRLRGVPGVDNAALAYSLPTLGSNWWNAFTISGTSLDHFPFAGMVPVSAGYFETMKIPLVEGRYFSRTDTSASEPVAIITRGLARRYWPDQSPIGQRLTQGRPNEPYGPPRTIVGVVADIKQHGLDEDAPDQIFMPIVQQPRTTVYAVVRTHARVSSASLEAAVHGLDRTIPVFNDRTFGQVMQDATNRRRIAMIVLSVFGAAAVLLAAMGLYGVIAHGVAERRQEIGVRMALGATGRQIVQLFVRQGLLVVVVGLAVGVAAATAASKSLASLVFGVTVRDPATFAAVAGLLAIVALMACYLPARSATRVDPLEALRSE